MWPDPQICPPLGSSLVDENDGGGVLKSSPPSRRALRQGWLKQLVQAFFRAGDILHAGPKVPATVSMRPLCVYVPSLGLMTRPPGLGAASLLCMELEHNEVHLEGAAASHYPGSDGVESRWVRESEGCSRQN